MMTTEERNEAMIDAACAWWGREMGVFHDMNKEAALNADGFAVAMMAMLAPVPNGSEAEKVVRELRTILHQYAAAQRNASLGVDYHPEGVLYDAIKAAGNPRVSLPFKTSMWIDWDDGDVTVKKGYGAEIVTIYPDTNTAGGAETNE